MSNIYNSEITLLLPCLARTTGCFSKGEKYRGRLSEWQNMGYRDIAKNRNVKNEKKQNQRGQREMWDGMGSMSYAFLVSSFSSGED